jgi:peptidyl-prolyl cis-trans isomerase A (cyclophilin A)
LTTLPHHLQRRNFARQALAVTLIAFVPVVQAQTRYPRVTVHTSMGNFSIELYPDKAPVTVENFLQYVRAGFYNDTLFHRVMPNFMVQGGGFHRDFSRKATREPILLESQNGLRNDTGWVAMARTKEPNTATAQFFINTVDNPSLNYPAPDGHGYAVFGKVVQGMDIVNKIRVVPTHGYAQHRDVPFTPVVIDKIVSQN